MARTIAEFYLLAMFFAFVITLIVGVREIEYSQVFMFAALSWPLAAMVLVAKSRLNRILNARTGET
ncbi:MAG: hypothetical protein AAGE76_08340 [Pseudomonadota bacterium]